MTRVSDIEKRRLAMQGRQATVMLELHDLLGTTGGIPVVTAGANSRDRLHPTIIVSMTVEDGESLVRMLRGD